MPRKKKENLTNTTTTPTNVTGYEGVVTIDVMQKGTLISSQKIHNLGMYPLFQYICRALASESYSRPEFLAFSTNAIQTPISLASSFNENVQYRSKLTVTTIDRVSAGYQLNWTSTASYSGLSSIGTNTLKSIALYTTGTYNTGETLAMINLSNPISIQQGQSLIIKWSMLFKNAGV